MLFGSTFWHVFWLLIKSVYISIQMSHPRLSGYSASVRERPFARTHWTESDLGRRRDGAYYIEWHISSWRNKNYKRPPSRTLKILSLDMVKRLRCDAIRLPTVARLDLNIISCLSGKDCQRAAVCVCVEAFLLLMKNLWLTWIMWQQRE